MTIDYKHPLATTMFRTLYEDENPIVEINRVFESLDGEIYSRPAIVKAPIFTTPEEGAKKVEWELDCYKVDRPCRLVALEVKFLDHNDTAIVPFNNYRVFNEGDDITGNYHIDYTPEPMGVE